MAFVRRGGCSQCLQEKSPHFHSGTETRLGYRLTQNYHIRLPSDPYMSVTSSWDVERWSELWGALTLEWTTLAVSPWFLEYSRADSLSIRLTVKLESHLLSGLRRRFRDE